MSVLSASGLLNPAQADSYTAALLHLLGNQNPVQVLRETPDALRNAIERIPLHQIDAPEAPGKWSTRIVIAHLADSELVGAFRLRMILAHDRPQLLPYDQDEWAKRLRYEASDIEESLERFSVLRRANLKLWTGVSPTDLARVGVHAERGDESIEHMRRLYAGHDLAHLHQLSRIRIVVTGH